ncbi:hypothetical protein K466DRAFT_591827 [Polyporus arcularius HHB13444]|uniref:Uncharacterized protein n=1 Tax=Polyporus arcularius HHB13444 TaxID=1314778 RepID=A0A5C3NV79_9APHY|nr:hypothetical protein K466DRAFT_591827 [Polyporus arcularius HHB13444]
MSDDLAGVCCASLGAMLEICLVGACYDFASFTHSCTADLCTFKMCTRQTVEVGDPRERDPLIQTVEPIAQQPMQKPPVG